MGSASGPAAILFIAYLLAGAPGTQILFRWIRDWIFPLIPTVQHRDSDAFLSVNNSENTTVIVCSSPETVEEAVSAEFGEADTMQREQES